MLILNLHDECRVKGILLREIHVCGLCLVDSIRFNSVRFRVHGKFVWDSSHTIYSSMFGRYFHL